MQMMFYAPKKSLKRVYVFSSEDFFHLLLENLFVLTHYFKIKIEEQSIKQKKKESEKFQPRLPVFGMDGGKQIF